MSLQSRLTYLLIAFAAFSLLAAFGTMYGVRQQARGAIVRVQTSLDDGTFVDSIRLDLERQELALDFAVNGKRAIDELYLAEIDMFLDRLNYFARYAATSERKSLDADIETLIGRVSEEIQKCVVHLKASDPAAAAEVHKDELSSALLPALDLRLRQIKSTIESNRRQSIDALDAANVRLLYFAIVVGVAGMILITVGSAMIRRWVILPVRLLHAATEEFARGKLDHRVKFNSKDELGALSSSMNRMARGLAEAQQELIASERKYRALFENLRDAVIVCTARGKVIEYHGGKEHLLGENEAAFQGMDILQAWPHWNEVQLDWRKLIDRVASKREQVRVPDLLLRTHGDKSLVFDLVAYPVGFAGTCHTAIVLLNATERKRLERQTHQTQAMEATVNFARGVAHDFGNLLHSIELSLSRIEKVLPLNHAARTPLQRASHASLQAASLAGKLQSFAGGHPGRPEIIRLCETVELILESLDESLMEGIVVQKDCEHEVTVRIDKDQFTQIALNLIHNACEAMKNGGELHVTLKRGRLDGLASPQMPATHAVFTVEDTGPGMEPDTAQRIFEPFFSTKGEKPERSRGLGLAITYAAVKNANGTINVSSSTTEGTAFRIYLPLAAINDNADS